MSSGVQNHDQHSLLSVKQTFIAKSCELEVGLLVHANLAATILGCSERALVY